MTGLAIFAQHRRLAETMRRLGESRTLNDFVEILRSSGRAIAAAEGVALIRRDGDLVSYIAEDAIAPLWTGRSFSVESCISGQAIVAGAPILIPDILSDPRVPHAAYRPTFVRSMAMYPIGLIRPTMAIGAYWREAGPIDPGAAALLTALSRFAGIQLARLAGSQRMTG